MPSREEILAVLKTQYPHLAAKYGVNRLGIFGSLARRENQPGSDLDILVDFDRPIGLEFVELADFLEEVLQIKVDLVSRGAIRPERWKYIAEDLIYV